MILQNKNGDNKVFIDSSLLGIFEINEDNENVVLFSIDDNTNISINENIFLYDIRKIIYEPESDSISIFIGYSMYGGSTIQIKENQLVSLSYEKETLYITTVDIPMFMVQDDTDDIYPKFEINISECIYSMKIYLNESEYVEVPYYQSHNDIITTLNHINDVVYFLKEDQPLFMKVLCNSEKTEINVFDKEDKTKCIGCNVYEYKISTHGVVLFDESFENGMYLVEWQKLFRLLIDKIWEMKFTDIL